MTGLVYLQDTNYVQHVNEVFIDGKIRYACRICGAHYQSAKICYHGHVKGKHLGRLFKCRYCPYVTPYKACMQKHIAKKHPSKSDYQDK